MATTMGITPTTTCGNPDRGKGRLQRIAPNRQLSNLWASQGAIITMDFPSLEPQGTLHCSWALRSLHLIGLSVAVPRVAVRKEIIRGKLHEFAWEPWRALRLARTKGGVHACRFQNFLCAEIKRTMESRESHWTSRCFLWCSRVSTLGWTTQTLMEGILSNKAELYHLSVFGNLQIFRFPSINSLGNTQNGQIWLMQFQMLGWQFD